MDTCALIYSMLSLRSSLIPPPSILFQPFKEARHQTKKNLYCLQWTNMRINSSMEALKSCPRFTFSVYFPVTRCGVTFLTSHYLSSCLVIKGKQRIVFKSFYRWRIRNISNLKLHLHRVTNSGKVQIGVSFIISELSHQKCRCDYTLGVYVYQDYLLIVLHKMC